MVQTFQLAEVFVPGGQPTITYVSRDDLSVEQNVKRALAKPHYFASITGSSKTGKTVLCRNALEGRQYVWIEGGHLTPLDNIWRKIAYHLEKPSAVSYSRSSSTSIDVSATTEGKGKVPFFAEASIGGQIKGSRVRDYLVQTQETIDFQATCLRHMIENNIILIVDDFHYVDRDLQKDLIRALKGPVFEGLKVVLLSVSYRAYEAIAAETDIAGRLTHVDVPAWGTKDLRQIAQKGFKALNLKCPARIIDEFAREASGSPQLMQAFCWELCFDREIMQTCGALAKVPPRLGFADMYKRLAKEAAQSVFDKLVLGPQARSDRMQRPLKTGGTADIYQVVLMAIANTGPKTRIRFGEIRENVNSLLADNQPQQIEISNALKYLTDIATSISAANRPLDWNDEKKELVLPEPLFRFFLKWQVAGVDMTLDRAVA